MCGMGTNEVGHLPTFFLRGPIDAFIREALNEHRLSATVLAVWEIPGTNLGTAAALVGLTFHWGAERNNDHNTLVSRWPARTP